MSKEHEAAGAEKVIQKKPVEVQTGLDAAMQIETASPAPAKWLDLPVSLQKKHIRAMQRVAGNRYIQRVLNRHVIQRAPPTAAAKEQPIPLLPDVKARRELAISILKKAYGGFIKQETAVVEVANEDTLRGLYDQSMIEQDKTFNGEPWKSGDSKVHPQMSGDFPGFRDPRGAIYIDGSRKPDEQVVTIAHELLHANAAGDFLEIMGRSADEGMTEMLTQKAISKAGYAAAGGKFMVGEVGMMGKLVDLVGQNTMMMAYFTGIGPLKGAVMGMHEDIDDEVWGKILQALRDGDLKMLDYLIKKYAEELPNEELEKKRAALNDRLNGIVTDNDINAIGSIWASCTPEERAELGPLILGRAHELNDMADRVKLRAMVGF